MYYELIEPRRGRLKLDFNYFQTPITGHRATIRLPPDKACRLNQQGHLRILKGYEWDFASGAIDTPDMVKASLAHDALCDLINAGELPRSIQPIADKYFYTLLKQYGTGWFRRWYSYLAVRFYQKFLKRK